MDPREEGAEDAGDSKRPRKYVYDDGRCMMYDVMSFFKMSMSLIQDVQRNKALKLYHKVLY